MNAPTVKIMASTLAGHIAHKTRHLTSSSKCTHTYAHVFLYTAEVQAVLTLPIPVQRAVLRPELPGISTRELVLPPDP